MPKIFPSSNGLMVNIKENTPYNGSFPQGDLMILTSKDKMSVRSRFFREPVIDFIRFDEILNSSGQPYGKTLEEAQENINNFLLNPDAVGADKTIKSEIITSSVNTSQTTFQNLFNDFSFDANGKYQIDLYTTFNSVGRDIEQQITINGTPANVHQDFAFLFSPIPASSLSRVIVDISGNAIIGFQFRSVFGALITINQANYKITKIG